MYYAEKVVDGKWFFQTVPGDMWIPFTMEMLQEKITELQNKIVDLEKKNI